MYKISRLIKLFLYCVLCIGTCIFCSCESKPLLYEISSENKDFLFKFYAQSQQLQLTTNFKWNLVEYPNWIEPAQTQGDAGNHHITLHCIENLLYTSREGKIKAQCGDKSIVINISQESSSPLTLNIKDTTLFKNDLEFNIGVISPIEYDIIIPEYADWIKVAALPDNFKSGKVKFKLTPLSDGEKERKASIVFAGKQSKNIRDTVKITQNNREYDYKISTDKKELSFMFANTPQKVNIEASHAWNIVNPHDWIQITPNEGNSWIKEMSIVCTPILDKKSRSGTISVICGDRGVNILINQKDEEPVQVEHEKLYIPDSRAIFSIPYKSDYEIIASIREGSEWLKIISKTDDINGEIIFETTPRANFVEQRMAIVDLICKDVPRIKTTITINQSRTYSANYEILKSLFDKMDGANWTNNKNWLSLSHYSQWAGVITDTEKITSLNLSNNNLAGRIPQEIGFLSDLQELNLSNNHLQGGVPNSLFSLQNLNKLDLSYNAMQFPFPENINNLSKLSYLRLSGLQLNSTIPISLTELSNLQDLYIDNCSLSGNIPEKLWEMHTLVNINMSNNNLSGAINCSNKLINLKTLNISNNNISSQIMPLFGLLPKLEEINLRNNFIIGCVPMTLIKKLGEKYTKENLAQQKEVGNPNKSIVLPMNKYTFGDLIYEGDTPVALVLYPYYADGGVASGPFFCSEYAFAVSLDFTELKWSSENVTIGANDTFNGSYNYLKYKEYIAANPQSGEYPAFEWCMSYNKTHGDGWYIPTPYEISEICSYRASLRTFSLLTPSIYSISNLLSSFEFSNNMYMFSNVDFINNICREEASVKSMKKYILLVKKFKMK